MLNNYFDKYLFFLNLFYKVIRDKLMKYFIDFCFFEFLIKINGFN